MKKQTERIYLELLDRYPVLAAVKEDIAGAYEIIYKAFDAGNRLYICGNGGSASDSEHITGELMKSFKIPRPLLEEDADTITAKYPDDAEYLIERLQRALPSVALVSNAALFSAYCNDVDADMAFAQQVFGYGRAGDVLLAISTSGSAKNVINALMVANAMGLKTVGLSKQGGGGMLGLCDICVKVPCDETYAVQELHLPVYHAWCAMLENEFFMKV